MAAIIFIIILIFIIAIQAFLPKFLKESEAFGIYIPDTHVKDKRIEHMKNGYTKAILRVGLLSWRFLSDGYGRFVHRRSKLSMLEWLLK